MAKILLLEDDRLLSRGVKIALEKDKHEVIQAYSFFEGVELHKEHDPDLYLLDINLPDGNGTEFCRKIRETSSRPVIFLTADDTDEDMVKGFQAGGDDYVAKPFATEVLRQRVLAVLRRSRNPDAEVIRYKELEVNLGKMIVRCAGAEVKLTATEFRLLEYMIRNRGRVLTRAMLLEQIWDTGGNFVDENTLSVHIRRLRQKIETDPARPEYIITVFGIGYTFGE